MKISIDNGRTFYDIDELNEIQSDIIRLWDAIVTFMDNDTREDVHTDLAPCTEIEFLSEYLRRAPFDLVVG